MDIVSILSSINKVSLTAFVVTLGVLIYEIYHLRKEKSIRRVKPVIPSFDHSKGSQPMISATPIVLKENDIKKNPNFHKIIFILLLVMLLIFGFLSVSSLFTPQQNVERTQEAQVALQEVQSSGIKIYDSNWQEIEGDTTNLLGPGNTMYIGIAMVKGSDIDKARIKVNSGEWTISDITSDYNNEHNVFYKMYIIKETESKLEIEAQLYSKSKGWLSE